MEKLTLVEPSEAYEEAFLDMARETHAAGEGRYAPALRDFAAFVERLRKNDRAEDLPADRVPMTSYWLLREDGRFVGSSSLRHRLLPHLEVEGGHIGYAVRPSERRKGYGTRQLALVLEKARARGIHRVLVTCDDDNVGSVRIIGANGGDYDGTSPSPEGGQPVRRYWIENR